MQARVFPGGQVKAEMIAADHRFAQATRGTGGTRPSLHVVLEPLSMWTRSRAKHLFDVALVIAALPLVAPICLLIAAAIWISCGGPVFFVQKRAGWNGRLFSILKFRTMVHPSPAGKSSITTIDDELITGVGRFLRYWKLDELPQLFNVLRGQMSLVGPRPLVPEQQMARLRCRPGITGAASLVFAREEVLLAGIPREQLDGYYASQVLPLKQQLDDAYMARATFLSDLKLLFKTGMTVWTSAGAPRGVDDAGMERCGMQALPGEGCD